MTAPAYPVGTSELVKVVVTSDRTLDTQVVELNVLGTWVPGTWVGAAGLTRTARTTSVVSFVGATKGYRTVYCRFTDSPELPIINAGSIVVTA